MTHTLLASRKLQNNPWITVWISHKAGKCTMFQILRTGNLPQTLPCRISEMTTKNYSFERGYVECVFSIVISVQFCKNVLKLRRDYMYCKHHSLQSVDTGFWKHFTELTSSSVRSRVSPMKLSINIRKRRNLTQGQTIANFYANIFSDNLDYETGGWRRW